MDVVPLRVRDGGLLCGCPGPGCPPRGAERAGAEQRAADHRAGVLTRHARRAGVHRRRKGEAEAQADGPGFDEAVPVAFRIWRTCQAVVASGFARQERFEVVFGDQPATFCLY